MANIIETAKGAGCFATLLTAVEVAGLTGALESPGPFTVFAPVDDAFAALPPFPSWPGSSNSMCSPGPICGSNW
jgi:uncharacterized surface protein with fasciclin (FAS1) repeats